MRRLFVRRRGITLVELLITVTILAIVAPGILMASGTAARVGRSTQKRAAAIAIAERQLELFRTMCRYSSITPGTVNSTEDGLKMGTFSITRVISETDGLGACDVTVSWSDTNGNGVTTEVIELGTMMREGD